jgi:hypothetical protein
MKTLEIVAKGPGLLKLGADEYVVSFPFPILLKLQDKLGRPMLGLADFIQMSREEIPTILEHGLRAHNPGSVEIAERALNGMDAEEDLGRMADFLSGSAFPRTMERFSEQLERLKDGTEILKNAPSADAYSKMLRAIGLIFGQSASTTTALPGMSSSS